MMFEKKVQVLFFVCGLCIFYNSCREEYCRYSEYLQCNSGSQNPKLLWSVQISDEISGRKVYPGGEGFPYYENIVAVGYGRETNRAIGFVGLDLNTGKKLWETPLSERLSTTSPFVMLYRNVILPRSTRRFALMDVKTGAIVEDKTISGYYWADIQKLGDRLIYPGAVRNSKGLYDECFFQASVNAPFNIEVLLPPNKRTEFVGSGSGFNIFTDRFRCKIFVGKNQYEGDTLLLFHQADPMFDGAIVGQDYLHSINLYNISKKQWIYRHKEGPTPLYIDEASGKMFMTYFDSYNYRDRDNPRFDESKVYGYDLYTGEQLWVCNMPYKNIYSAIVDGDILILGEKSGTARGGGYTYGINVHTGQVIWRSHYLAYDEYHLLNGVVYFARSKLIAIDTRTGELLWNITPAESFSYLQAIPGKNGEKGKIVAYDYLNAYCYEAIR